MQFNRELKKLQRLSVIKNIDQAEIYYNRLGIYPIVSRLQSIIGKKFSNVCYLGPMSHLFYEQIASFNSIQIQSLTILDLNKASLNYSLQQIEKLKSNSRIRVVGLQQDEENWRFPENYFNLIVSVNQVHWINDTEKLFKDWMKSLVPDGALIGCIPIGDSCQELRAVIQLAEMEREGGVGSHISPIIGISEIGTLMHRLDYKLITVNSDLNTLHFDSMMHLMYFLKQIGENNASLGRRKELNRNTFIAAEAIYNHLFKDSQHVQSTLEIGHFIGWKDHPSQQKPLRPGTKGVDIKDIAAEVEDDDLEQGEITED